MMIGGSGSCYCGGRRRLLLHLSEHRGFGLGPLLLLVIDDLLSGCLLFSLLLQLLGGLLLELCGSSSVDEEAVLVPLLALPLGGTSLQLLHLQVLEAVVVAVVPLEDVLNAGGFLLELVLLPTKVRLELRHYPVKLEHLRSCLMRSNWTTWPGSTEVWCAEVDLVRLFRC